MSRRITDFLDEFEKFMRDEENEMKRTAVEAKKACVGPHLVVRAARARNYSARAVSLAEQAFRQAS